MNNEHCFFKERLKGTLSYFTIYIAILQYLLDRRGTIQRIQMYCISSEHLLEAQILRPASAPFFFCWAKPLPLDALDRRPSASGSPGCFQNLGPIQDQRDSLYVSSEKVMKRCTYNYAYIYTYTYTKHIV